MNRPTILVILLALVLSSLPLVPATPGTGRDSLIAVGEALPSPFLKAESPPAPTQAVAAEAEGETCQQENGTLVLPADCTGTAPREGWISYRLVARANQTLVVRLSMETTSTGLWSACLYRGPTPYCQSLHGQGELVFPRANAQDQQYGLYFNGPRWENASYRLLASAHEWQLTDDCDSGMDSTDQAPIVLPLSGACEGSLNPATDVSDAYTLDLRAGEAATVTLQPNPEADFDVCAYDEADQVVACAQAPFGRPDPIYLSPSVAQRFTIRPYIWDGAENYTLTATPTAAQDDCGTLGDAGSPQRPLARPDPFTCSGGVDGTVGDAWDFYAITIPEGTGLRFSLNTTTGFAWACLYSPTDPVYYIRCAQPGETLAHLSRLSETWLLGVYSSAGASYELSAGSFEPSPQNDCASGGDAPGYYDPGLRVPIQPGTPCKGVVRGDEGELGDWLSIEVPDASMTIRIEATADLGYCVQIGSSGWCNRTSERPEFTIQTLRSSVWNVSIGGDWETSISYTVNVTLSPPYDDCGTGGDAGSWEYYDRRPRSFTTPADCEGTLAIPSGDRSDAYAVPLQFGETLLIEFEGDTPHVEVCLYDSRGAGYCETEPDYPGGPIRLDTTTLSLTGETVLIVVQMADYSISSDSTYRLRAHRTFDLTRISPTDLPLP